MEKGVLGIVIAFFVVLFFMWLFTGGPNHAGVNNPHETPYTDQINGIYAK